jgi:hypothetical protein
MQLAVAADWQYWQALPLQVGRRFRTPLALEALGYIALLVETQAAHLPYLEQLLADQ